MRKFSKIIALIFVATTLILISSSIYFIRFALTPKDRLQFDKKHEYAIMKNEYPYMEQWIDSISVNLADIYTINSEGYRLHAIYTNASKKTRKTAIIIHGYKMNAISMLHIAYLYNHVLNYNVLLPDLQGHGLSQGDEIQMGWKDKNDIKQWITLTDSIFGGNTQIVITGISMGGATTMMVSGDTLPDCVRCFVEDCGYTSVWDEFKGELKNQFGLPAFPLLNVTSAVNELWHGWNFTEASSLNQVMKCHKPMLFIHGDNDTYVPTAMVYELYKAKAEPKEIYISKGSAHANSYKDNPDLYTAKVRDFVSKYIH